MKHTKSILLLLNHQSYSPLFPAIAEYAKSHDWRLAIEDRLAPPWGWHGDGVLIDYLDHPVIRRFAESLTKSRIPIVDLNGILKSSYCWSVCPNCTAIGQLAAEHFRERGYTKAAWFSLIWTPLHADMLDGFTRSFGIKPAVWTWMRKRSYPCGYDCEKLLSFLTQKLKEAAKPLAIFAYDTYNATYILRACERAGLSVPEDVALIAGNNVPQISDAQTKTISCIQHNPKVATVALQTLEQAIAKKHHLLRRTELPPIGIIARESTNMITAEDPRLARALRFIVNHLSEDISTLDIAADANLSRSTIDKFFIARLGHTTRAEILRQRILRAKILLSETTDKLEVIAEQTGFCHASYFIKAFQRETGQTPFIWRRKARTRIRT